jgi:hypothetical protein
MKAPKISLLSMNISNSNIIYGFEYRGVFI